METWAVIPDREDMLGIGINRAVALVDTKGGRRGAERAGV